MSSTSTQPATPFVLLGAALAFRRLALDRDPRMLAALALAAFGSLISPADLALRGVPVFLSRASLAILHLGGLAAAFGLAAAAWARGRRERSATMAAGLLLIVPTLAASIGDPSWRSFFRALDRGVRHEIVLGDEGESALGRAREAYLLLDLELPEGDPSGLRLEFATGPSEGRAQPHGLRPRHLREAGTPDLPVVAHGMEAGMTGDGASTELRARPRAPAGELTLPGEGTRSALSLGQWPYQSVYRLMHDGEYRLATTERLSGPARSFSGGRELPGLLGIRAVILDDAAGGAAWETVPAASSSVVTGIWAKAGRQARADCATHNASSRLEARQRVGGARWRVFRRRVRGWFVIARRRSRAGPSSSRSCLSRDDVGPEIRPAGARREPADPLDWRRPTSRRRASWPPSRRRPGGPRGYSEPEHCRTCLRVLSREAAMLTDLAVTPIADTLRRLSAEMRSGDLQVRSGKIVKTLFFDRGRLVFAASNLKKDRLGESLVALGRITDEQFNKAAALMKDRKQRFRGPGLGVMDKDEP
jgi:hypothetical protein